MSKIVVRGPALSRSGYGEHTRFLLRSLRKYEDVLDIYLLNVPWGQTGWIWEDDEERRWIDSIIGKTSIYIGQGGAFDLSAQVTIPNEWEKLAPINIGVTAGIETTKVSPQWVEKSMVVDKIVTISEHAAHVFETTSYQAKNEQTGEIIDNFRCSAPVDVVHYPVRDFEPAEIDLELEHDFNFLTIAQVSPRKNIHNTIKWFVEAFKEQNVGLVAKLNIKCNSYQDRTETVKGISAILENYKDAKCKVYVLHGSMTDQEMTALYRHPKIKSYLTSAK